jgi:glycosyltransferase involved in cell wall biosynthesis
MMDADQPLRILHLASSERWTGVAEPAAGLAARQIDHGHQVAFACIGGSSFERRLADHGVPLVAGFHFDRRLNPAHVREDIRRLRHYVEQNQPHILHCHLPHDHWLTALALRRPLSRFAQWPATAIVRTVHRESAPRSDLPHRWLMGKATDMVIVVSLSGRQALVEEVGLPSVKVVRVRGAVDLDRFRPDLSPTIIRDACDIPHEARVAGMVARMQPHRGHHMLIDALEEVVAAVPTALIALAGRGEIKRELVERIRNHPLRHHLKRIGYRKHDLPETYAAMDVVVLMTPGSDGSCRAMLEAMACGRPVIGARIGAMVDTIEPGVSGWLFRPDRREELVAVLIDALADLDRARRMGKAARRHVETWHDPERQCRETLEVYREALSRRAVSRGRR